MNTTGAISGDEGPTSSSPPAAKDLKKGSNSGGGGPKSAAMLPRETPPGEFEEYAPLRNFLLQARSAEDLPALLDAVKDFAPLVSDAAVCAVVLQTSTGVEIRLTGISDGLVDRYVDYTASRPDPLRAALATTHGAIRSNELFTAAQWHQHPFHREVLMPFGIDAAMMAEVSDATTLRGAIAVGRMAGYQPFCSTDASRLQSLCLHTSVALTRIAQQVKAPHHLRDQLTLKQQQLVRMVANGLTNDQIASACGVTVHAVKKSLERLFARFHVSSRAELIATLGVPAEDL
jgi:DNA-binding CsgD family transcriptional regulator